MQCWRADAPALDALFCSILFSFGLVLIQAVKALLRENTVCFFLPKADNAATCEESTVGHQMGSGCAARSVKRVGGG